MLESEPELEVKSWLNISVGATVPAADVRQSPGVLKVLRPRNASRLVNFWYFFARSASLSRRQWYNVITM